MKDFVIQEIERVLSGRKIVWIGGGYYLAKPSLARFLSGGMVFSMEKAEEGRNRLGCPHKS